MKHIISDSEWAWSETPFPAYRCELIFGRNKRDSAFLPVKDIFPEPDVDGYNHLLPEGRFRVIKTRKKGTILIVPGNDNSDRCLAMVGISGGFRGGCWLKKEDTTANILKTCSAASACDSHISVAAIMGIGQKVVFRSTGRRNNTVIVFEYDGESIISSCFTKEEYDACASADYDGDAL